MAVRIDAIRIFSLVFFFIPWRIVMVNLTGLWLRLKQDFILLSALFLRCGQPWKILWITTKNSWSSEMVIWCNEKVPLPEISSLSKRKQPSNKFLRSDYKIYNFTSLHSTDVFVLIYSFNWEIIIYKLSCVEKLLSASCPPFLSAVQNLPNAQ